MKHPVGCNWPLVDADLPNSVGGFAPYPQRIIHLPSSTTTRTRKRSVPNIDPVPDCRGRPESPYRPRYREPDILKLHLAASALRRLHKLSTEACDVSKIESLAYVRVRLGTRARTRPPPYRRDTEITALRQLEFEPDDHPLSPSPDGSLRPRHSLHSISPPSPSFTGHLPVHRARSFSRPRVSPHLVALAHRRPQSHHEPRRRQTPVRRLLLRSRIRRSGNITSPPAVTTLTISARRNLRFPPRRLRDVPRPSPATLIPSLIFAQYLDLPLVRRHPFQQAHPFHPQVRVSHPPDNMAPYLRHRGHSTPRANNHSS